MIPFPAASDSAPSTCQPATPEEWRSRLLGHGPAVVWLTGLSGAGKSTLAALLERRLLARGTHTFVLDGDEVRHGLNRDLGYDDASRDENLRRAAEVARLLARSGLVVIASFISPCRRQRDAARTILAGVPFFEVHVSTPMAVAERRDPKGLYRRARRGEISDFTGVQAPYEVPVAPDLRIDTSDTDPEASADLLLERLLALGLPATHEPLTADLRPDAP
jgi:bifunctional enzyme CysN/CysC